MDMYRVTSQDSTGSEFRSLESLPGESCELILFKPGKLPFSLGH